MPFIFLLNNQIVKDFKIHGIQLGQGCELNGQSLVLLVKVYSFPDEQIGNMYQEPEKYSHPLFQ